MQEADFNLPEDLDLYTDVDYLNKDKMDNITSDNLFLAFIKQKQELEFSVVAAIDDEIYNFSTHKFLDSTCNFTYASAFSDVMPREIWRLIYIRNYGIITVDIDDDKYFIIEEWIENNKNKFDPNAKDKITRNRYIPPRPNTYSKKK